MVRASLGSLKAKAKAKGMQPCVAAMGMECKKDCAVVVMWECQTELMSLCCPVVDPFALKTATAQGSGRWNA